MRLYNPTNRHDRQPTRGERLDSGSSAGMTPAGGLPSLEGRWRCYSYDECMARDKASLDIFWLKDDGLDHLDELPPPEVLAQEIIDHLEAALASFRDVATGLVRR